MSRTEPLNDFDERAVAAAEADLERLLSIEPSAEFTAKVRVRIAEEKTNRTTRWKWIGLLAAVATAVIAVVVLRSSFETGAERPSSTPSHADIVLKADTNDRQHPIVPIASVTRQSARHIRRAAEPRQQTEIIIDPAISEAIRRLAVAARSTRLDGSNGESMAAPNSESATLPIAEPLDVPELALRPADQTGGQ